MRYRRIASLKTAGDFRHYLAKLGVEMPFDDEVATGPDAPLAQPYRLPDGFVIGNRFCIQPMEGWDGTPDGRPTELTLRRWTNFGQSGAKLIWGGEAVAVRHDGRANPNQLLINEANWPALAGLRQALVEAHEARYGSGADLLVGLQLTHSGRFAPPNCKTDWSRRSSTITPCSTASSALPPTIRVMTTTKSRGWSRTSSGGRAGPARRLRLRGRQALPRLPGPRVPQRRGPARDATAAASRTARASCARWWPASAAEAPGLRIGVRLSAFDFVPFRPGPDGVGRAGRL